MYYGVANDGICECEDDDSVEDCPCRSGLTAEAIVRFAETVIYGIINGIVAYFSFQCSNGLYGFVDAIFRIFDHYQIWLP